MGKAIVLMLFVLIFATGCVNNERVNTETQTDIKASDGTKVFDITVYHTSIDPAIITVNHGDKVKLKLKTATGTEDHNHGVTIDEYSINVANTDSSNPTEIEFTADKTGEFIIYCKPCWDGKFGRGHPDIRAKLIVR